jgi:hypothetical protein
MNQPLSNSSPGIYTHIEPAELDKTAFPVLPDLARATLTTYPANYINVTTCTVAFASNRADYTAFDYQLDGNQVWTRTAQKWVSITNMAEGMHSIRVRAVNPLTQEVDINTAYYEWFVDLSIPETRIVQAPALISSSVNARFRFNSPTDPFARFEYKLDAGVWTSNTVGVVDLQMLSENQHVFQVRAIDLAGNVDPVGDSYTWSIDTHYGQATLQNIPNLVTDKDWATITVGGAGVIGYKWSLDGLAYSAAIPVAIPLALTHLQAGVQHLFVYGCIAGDIWQPAATQYQWNIVP